MPNNFEYWSNLKQNINSTDESKIPYFREWQVWFISMWLNIGYEEDWKNEDYSRPVLILKKFSKDVFLWLPTTSIPKTWKFYYDIWEVNWINNFVILSQIKLYSSKRLLSRIWWKNKEMLIDIKKKISKLIE